MLRIMVRSQTPEEVVLEVDGWLGGDDVDLLEQELARCHQEAKCLILDLDGVRFIDEEMLDSLKRQRARGVVLQGGSSFVRELLKTYELN